MRVNFMTMRVYVYVYFVESCNIEIYIECFSAYISLESHL